MSPTPGTLHRIEFFENFGCDPSGYGEGRTYIGATEGTTDGVTCLASFSVSLPPLSVGRSVTATATGPDGSTSGFSACAVVTALPPPVPAVGSAARRALLGLALAAFAAWRRSRPGAGPALQANV